MIVIIPGLAVREYVKPAAQALADRGHDAHLLRAPTWAGAPTDLRRYGEVLARQVNERGKDVELLVGLSLGTQAAAWAAASTVRIRRLLLVSPTVDPRNRTVLRLARVWLFGNSDDETTDVASQLRDWAHAGPVRIALGYRSGLRDRLESTLPRVAAEVTVMHADRDSIGTAEWARDLARIGGGRYLRREGAPHSWPVGDVQAFADLVDELVR